MRRFSHLFALFSLLLLCSRPSFGQAWSGILAPSRAIDWSNTGIPGGIPDGGWSNCATTACNTAYSNPTAANINSACASAPSDTVVRIPAGTYTLSASIACNTNHVVLRGAGPTQTTVVLNGHNILMGNGSGNQGTPPGGLGTTSLSTLTAGSTVLTVGSTSGLSAGQVVEIDELNDTYVNPTGNAGNENATRCSSPLNFFGCSTRSQMEWVRIASVNSGSNQITIAAPGLSKTYSSSLTPQIFYWSTTGVYSYDGVENMKVDAGTSTTSNFAVALVFCDECWVKNVTVVNAHRAGIYCFMSFQDEIQNNYLSASNGAGAPTEYGIECDRCFMSRIENNIEFGVTTPLITESAYGDVVAYNYTLRTVVDNAFPALDTHRSHVYDELYEGNVESAIIDWDNVWGSSSMNTAFRNYARGDEPNSTNYRTPIAVQANQRYINIVGNVLGLTGGFYNTYECDSANRQGEDNYIYDLGYTDGCVNGSLTDYDTVAESSLMRWGNWDAQTYAASGSSHGTRWCTGSGTGSPGVDAYNAACTVSETGSGDPTFPGLSSPSIMLPNSLYLSSQPSWWTTTWGTPIWPPIGPDVTCSTNCIANTASHAAEIPAQLCYNNSTQSNGFLTAFDADACYASDSGSTAPAPPTGLTATVQ
jgi:hypothetical protein